MSYCAVHNLNDTTNGRGCVECIRDERDAARAEAARLRDLVQCARNILYSIVKYSPHDINEWLKQLGEDDANA